MAVGATATNGAASRAVVFVGHRAHRDDDRGRRAGPDQQAQQPGPCTAAQADAVQPDERQQRARRMAGHVGDPRIGLVVEDSAGEAAERLGDVGDGRHLAQVFVAGGEPAGEAALPAVDHRQRERPQRTTSPTSSSVRARHGSRCARVGPHSTAATPIRIAGHRAPPDVGVPPSEDRRGSGEAAEPFGGGVDQRCDDAQMQVRDDESRHHQEDGDGYRHRLPATDLQLRHDRQGRGSPRHGVS